MMLTRSAHGLKVIPERCSHSRRTSSAMVGLYWNRLETAVGGVDRAWPSTRCLPIDDPAQFRGEPTTRCPG